MIVYYDSSVILKLYTQEPESDQIQAMVVQERLPILFTSLHLSECTSALMLKAFRGECADFQSKRAIADMDEDLANQVLKRQAIDWEAAWLETRNFALSYAVSCGCRTLDSLHVACARQIHAQKFITGDKRQAALAKQAGLDVLLPY